MTDSLAKDVTEVQQSAQSEVSDLNLEKRKLEQANQAFTQKVHQLTERLQTQHSQRQQEAP